MATKDYKSINALMKHMREKKVGNISIRGSRQKRLLRWHGYYHGYKGYRFYRKSNNPIIYSNFDELNAVIDYDMKLKALFYPQVMFLETALKNFVLEIVLKEAGSCRFSEIYSRLIHIPARGDRKHHLRQRDNIYVSLTRAYAHNAMVQHFYNRDDYVPIWAIFEIISLGDFGNFVSALGPGCRKKISVELGLRQSSDTNHRLFQNLIFTLKDLRNAIAHNAAIFDCRFNIAGKATTPKKSVSNYISDELGVKNLSLHSIFEYVGLVVYLLGKLGVPKRDLKGFVKAVENCKNDLEKKVDRKISAQVIPTNTNKLLHHLKGI